MPINGDYFGLGFDGDVYQGDASRSSNGDAMMQQYTRQRPASAQTEGSYYVRAVNPLVPSPNVRDILPPLRKTPPPQMFEKKVKHLNPRASSEYTAPPTTDVPPPNPNLAPAENEVPSSSGPTAAATDGSTSTTQATEMQINEARSRALQVVQRFQQQKKEDDIEHANRALSRKRQVFYKQFEERLRLAMVKNLEYVAKVEDERLHQKLALQKDAEEYHTQLEEYHNKVLENRSKNFRNQKQQQQQQQQQGNSNMNNGNHQQAGIGTQQRQQQERKRKQQHVANDSVALYISNLPKDGSASEELMRALFGSYGSLRKIHFYLDKYTGDLKGDALVIYNVDDVSEKADLVDTVCSQMNGAELPCGTAVKVEPSDPLYALRKKKKMTSQYGPAAAAPEEKEEEPWPNQHAENGKLDESSQAATAEATSKGEGDDDDLDDFFASL